MDLSPKSLHQLEMLSDIFDVSRQLATVSYIWGGLFLDISRGVFLREHHGIDSFVLDLLSGKDDFIDLFRKKGYAAEYLGEFQLLKLKKWDEHASFNPINVENGVAMWRHLGNQGTVYFPAEWLDAAPRPFYTTFAYTAGPRFEYAFKKIASKVNPQWRLREKDKAALQQLEAMIDINPKEILRSVWSYNPFWITKGYDRFRGPTLVPPGP